MRTPRPDAEERFRALYANAYEDVLRFARRRVPPAPAEDVAAEVFLVAWRRLHDAPSTPGDARAWLFGIARNCLLNARRAEGRREALAVRVSEVAPRTDGPTDGLVALRVDLARAWTQLRTADQETLSLVVFEQLTSSQAAQVLGITPTSYRLRLLRARRALRRDLDAPSTPTTPMTPIETPMETSS